MNTSTPFESVANRIGQQIAARLNDGQADLPYVVTERLRASREQALSVRKRPALVSAHATQTAAAQDIYIHANGSASLGTGPSGGWVPQWLRHALTAIPIAAMVAGIAFVGIQQDSSSTQEVAELDTALLTDTLPPDAYTDPGFIQYLQSERATPAQ